MRLWLCAALSLALVACSSGGSSGGGGGGTGARSGGGDSQDTLILPLVGAPLAGLDRDVLEQARKASEDGLGFDFVEKRLVSIPVAPSELLIRPGVMIVPESIFPGWCTAAFVFDNRSRIATAGHCTEVGDGVLALSLPSTVFFIGFTSQSTGANADAGNDWALIDILPIWKPFTDPAVAYVGGPCGRAEPTAPIVKWVGHPIPVGAPRFGVLSEPDGGAFSFIGPGYFGDSGSPVLELTQVGTDPPCAAGGAIGILTQGEVVTVGGVDTVPTGRLFGTPISRIGNSLDDGALLP